jgi:hypothetical protein
MAIFTRCALSKNLFKKSSGSGSTKKIEHGVHRPQRLASPIQAAVNVDQPQKVIALQALSGGGLVK